MSKWLNPILEYYTSTCLVPGFLVYQLIPRKSIFVWGGVLQTRFNAALSTSGASDAPERPTTIKDQSPIAVSSAKSSYMASSDLEGKGFGLRGFGVMGFGCKGFRV